jgi:hypothetical protein
MGDHGKDGRRAVLSNAIPTLDMLWAHLIKDYREYRQLSDMSEPQRGFSGFMFLHQQRANFGFILLRFS